MMSVTILYSRHAWNWVDLIFIPQHPMRFEFFCSFPSSAAETMNGSDGARLLFIDSTLQMIV